MKSKAITAEIRKAKFCHGAPSLVALADINVAHIVELPRLHVQVAIGQTGGLLHLHKGDRQAGTEGGQDAKATGGADYFVELIVHGVFNFIS